MAEVVITPQPHQQRFLECNGKDPEGKESIRVVFFGGGGGAGKALKNGSKVLTPSGWVNIENILQGDTIISPSGSYEKVLGVFPQGEVDLYRVTMDDGRHVEACGDHLWLYKNEGTRSLKIKTTKDLIGIYKESSCRIPLPQALEFDFTDGDLPIDPYLLGILLGDGDLSEKTDCVITSMDEEVIKSFGKAGISIKLNKHPSSGKALSYRVNGIGKHLRALELQGKSSHCKFIPLMYLNGSLKVRQSILSGLMDTGGYTTKTDGSMCYDTTSERLAKDVQYVVRSLGGRATILDKCTKYKEEYVHSYVVNISHIDSKGFSKLSREKSCYHQKMGAEGIKITDIQPTGVGHATCISVSGSRLFITDDFIVTHNTWSILIDNLVGVHDPDYFSVFFRKTNNELETHLWPLAKKLYDPILRYQNGEKEGKFRGKSHIDEQKKVITFPSGAKSKFSYMALDRDADSWYGSELAKIYWDELQAHSLYSFDVLRSRNRSMAKVPKGIRCTLNPASDHWMYTNGWIPPFLKDDGSFMPDLSLSGKVRYFVIVGGVLHTSWDKEELKSKFGKRPQTYTYIPATLKDNKVLMDNDPEYYDNLDSLPPEKRDQLLLGSWKPQEDSGMYFQRSWLKKATHVPTGSRYVRGWDTASEELDPSKDYIPDWTVGIKMAESPDGHYYICGMDRFRKRAGERDARILQNGYRDGEDCRISMSKDVGGAGKFQYTEFAKKAIKAGLKPVQSPIAATKSKLFAYEPFSIACANGLVYIVESMFDTEGDASLETFYKEHERFNGKRSNARKGYFDDIADATAETFATLATQRVVPIVRRQQQQQSTDASSLLVARQSIT